MMPALCMKYVYLPELWRYSVPSRQVCAAAVCIIAVVIVFVLITYAIIDTRRGHHGSAALMLVISSLLADMVFIVEWLYFIYK